MKTIDYAEPTPERLQHADGNLEIGGNKRDGRRYRMTDDPLGRILRRGRITPAEHHALKLYAVNWYAGGLAGNIGSVDLNRIHARISPSGLTSSEAQAHHKKLYQLARARLGARPAFVADNVACRDLSLDMTGMALGYKSPYHARAAALELLCTAAQRLIEFWRH